MRAAQNGKYVAAREMLNMGADPNVRDDYGDCTPLHLAARSDPRTTKSIMLMNCLLDKGADINALNEDECTPLVVAALNGHVASVSTLLRRGANPDIPDWYGRTPLCIAVQCPEEHSFMKINMVNILLDYGANPNTTGNRSFSPLFSAMLENNSDIANMLLDNGADPDPNRCDDSGRTPLNCLVERYCPLHNIGFARLLLALGADPNTSSPSGYTTLNFAVGNQQGCKELVEVLLANGANPNKPGALGSTPLFLAVARDCPEIVNTLLAHGARADIPNAFGHTAKSTAVDKNDDELVAILNNHIPVYQPQSLMACARTCIRSRLVENKVPLTAVLPPSDWLPLDPVMKNYLFYPLKISDIA
ncbi:ankyrin repeat domain-containing protein [Endozoicomonas sp. ONNA2]|uniref:ankyrin repeat domain-containing protein n=1 Tax=Endozoicomonas sp. ONNA2 TaxID=2828741 RepID=UPI00214830E7|nr:ankyrin repeat domain-containing protein [Endozoicomonas sp. ONNA2]